MNWTLTIASGIALIITFLACFIPYSENEKNIENNDSDKTNKEKDSNIWNPASGLLVGKMFYEDLKIFGASDFGEIVGVLIGSILIFVISFHIINRIMKALKISAENVDSRFEKAFIVTAVLNFILTLYSKF